MDSLLTTSTMSMSPLAIYFLLMGRFLISTLIFGILSLFMINIYCQNTILYIKMSNRRKLTPNK